MEMSRLSSITSDVNLEMEVSYMDGPIKRTPIEVVVKCLFCVVLYFPVLRVSFTMLQCCSIKYHAFIIK